MVGGQRLEADAAPLEDDGLHVDHVTRRIRSVLAKVMYKGAAHADRGEIRVHDKDVQGETYAHCCCDSRDVCRWRRLRDLDPKHARRRRSADRDAGCRGLCGRAGRGRKRGPDGPVRGRQRLAQGHQHAAGQRKVDLRGRTRCVRGKPESRLHALPRGTAENGGAEEHAAAAAGAEHQLPRRRTLARRDHRVAPGRRWHRSGHQEVDDGVGRERRHHRDQGPPVPHARRRRKMAALHRHRRRQRQHRRDVGSMGQAAAAPAFGVHQPV